MIFVETSEETAPAKQLRAGLSFLCALFEGFRNVSFISPGSSWISLHQEYLENTVSNIQIMHTSSERSPHSSLAT